MAKKYNLFDYFCTHKTMFHVEHYELNSKYMYLKIILIATALLCNSYTELSEVTLKPTLTLKKDHPIYLTITDIQYNTKENHLEIAIKIYTDDLNKAVMLQYNNLNPNIGTEKELPQAEDWIAKYVQKSLQIKTNSAQTLTYLGKEHEGIDALWCYFEIDDIVPFKNISIKNTLLTEIYPSQSNIINVFIAKNKKSLLLTKNNSEGELSFE